MVVGGDELANRSWSVAQPAQIFNDPSVVVESPAGVNNRDVFLTRFRVRRDDQESAGGDQSALVEAGHDLADPRTGAGYAGEAGIWMGQEGAIPWVQSVNSGLARRRDAAPQRRNNRSC